MYFYLVKLKAVVLSGVPIPKECILHKMESLGAFKGQKRWRDGKRLFTWDALHGEIEVFNSHGKHLAVWDPSGKHIKDATKGRTIDV